MRARVQYRRSRFSRVEENRESRVGRIERRKYSGEIGSKGGNNLLRPRFLRERARKEKFRRFRNRNSGSEMKKEKRKKKKTRELAPQSSNGYCVAIHADRSKRSMTIYSFFSSN